MEIGGNPIIYGSFLSTCHEETYADETPEADEEQAEAEPEKSVIPETWSTAVWPCQQGKAFKRAVKACVRGLSILVSYGSASGFLWVLMLFNLSCP